MRRLFTPGLLVRHGLVLVCVPAFLWLGWWQYGRAAGGNALSWAYTVQWPIFAGFAVFLWWREVRHALGREPAPRPPRRAAGFRAPVVTRPGAPGRPGPGDGPARPAGEE